MLRNRGAVAGVRPLGRGQTKTTPHSRQRRRVRPRRVATGSWCVPPQHSHAEGAAVAAPARARAPVSCGVFCNATRLNSPTLLSLRSLRSLRSRTRAAEPRAFGIAVRTRASRASRNSHPQRSRLCLCVFGDRDRLDFLVATIRAVAVAVAAIAVAVAVAIAG